MTSPVRPNASGRIVSISSNNRQRRHLSRRSSKAALALSAAAMLAATQLSHAADRTWNGGGENNSWTTVLNWIGGVAPSAGDSLTFDGFQTSNVNNYAAGTSFGGITFASTAGAFNLNGNDITLGGDVVDNATVLTEMISLNMALSATHNFNVVGNGFLNISGNISEAAAGSGITKLGDGVLTLSGNNTFSGPIMIDAGVLSVSSTANLGAAPGSPTPGALVINGGTLRSTGTLTISPNRGIALGPTGSAGEGSFDVATGTTVTYAGVIANNTGGTGSLNKLSFGTLSLSGANTYSGATRIKNGTVVLDFGAAGAPTSNIINSVSNLSFGGANAGLGNTSYSRLIMTGAASTVNSQAFASTSLDIGPSVIQVTSGTGGTSNLDLGAITHTTGSTMVFGLPASGSIHTTTANSNGILGGWATIGTDNQNGVIQGGDLATVNGSGNIVAYTGYKVAQPYNGTAATLLQGNVSASDNVRLEDTNVSEVRVAEPNSNVTVDINSFSFQHSPGATSGGTDVNTLTVGDGNTLRLGTTGTIFRQEFSNQNNTVIGGNGGLMNTDVDGFQDIGNLTAGGPNADTPGEIVFNISSNSETSGTFRVETKIVDNGAGTVTVIKTGAGSMKFDGHNTFSGGLYILSGRVQFAGSENGTVNPDGGGSGPLHIFPGAQWFPSGAASTTDPQVYNNPIFMAGSGINADNAGAIRLGGGGLDLAGPITLTGDSGISGGGGSGGNTAQSGLSYTIAAATVGTPLVTDTANHVSGKISGDHSMLFGSLGNVGGNGTAVPISNPANDWTGDTIIAGRTGGSSGPSILILGADEVIPDGVGKGNLSFGISGMNASSTTSLNMNGHSETVNGLTTENHPNPGSQAFIENNSFNATIVDNGGVNEYAFTPGPTSVLTVGNYDQSATYAGVIRDANPDVSVSLPDPTNAAATISVSNPAVTAGTKLALTKIGGGLQTLSGTLAYSGGTTINGGTLSVTGNVTNSGTATTVVNSGGALAGNSGSNLGQVTVNSGGHLSPGASGRGSIATLNVGSTTMNQGSSLDIDVSGSNADKVQADSGAFSFGTGSISISLAGSPLAGNYNIFHSNAALSLSGSGTFNLIQFPTIPNVRTASGTISVSSNDINLTVVGGAANITWTGSVNGDWDLNTTANFKNQATNLADKFFNGDFVRFDDSTSVKTVNLVGPLVPSGVTVDNSSGDYTFNGTGGMTGSGTLTKNGGSQLIINNPNSLTGTISLNGGTLVINDGGSLGTGTILVGGNGLTINNNLAMTVANPLDNGSEIRKSGTGTLTLSGASHYFGQMKINAGVVVPTNGDGADAGTHLSSFGVTDSGQVYVASGAAIDLNGGATANALNFGTKEFHIIGDGVSVTDGTLVTNSGALTNSGTDNQQNAFRQVVLDGDASVGGTGRFDVRFTPATGDNPTANAQLNLNGHTLTKNGSNQFSIVNTLITSGNIVANSGTLSLEVVTTTQGTGQITMNPSTNLQFYNNMGNNPGDPSATAPTITWPILINGENVIVGNASGTSTTGPAGSLVGSPITLAGNLNFDEFNATPGTLSFSGDITETGGSRSLVKNGDGVIVLSGNNSYTGTTTVNTGTLRVNGTHTGGGAYTIATGATLSGGGTISAQVNMASGSTLDPGTTTVVNTGSFVVQTLPATLTVGSLSLDSSNLQMDGDSTGMDRVNVTSSNGLTLNGTSIFNFADLGGLVAGTYTLIDYSGTALSNLSNFQVGSAPLGFTFNLFNNQANTSVDVNVGTVAIVGSVWNVDANGNWSVDTNWTGGVPNATDATANFANIITANRTVTVDAPQTVGTMNFANSHSYTIGGTSTLTLDVSSGNAGINVLSGSHTISAPVVLNDNTTINSSSGAGLNITGNLTATGQTITKAGGGTVQFANVRATGLNVTAGTARISSKGSANNSAGTSVVQSLSISSGATLDLTNNSAIIDYTSVGTLVGDVRQHLQSGRLTSSSADSQHRLGYGDNALLNKSSFAGQTPDTTSLLIKYTFGGDANLDGQVDVTDLGALATNWQTSNVWTGGDFNYDGFVDVTDLGILATDWQLGVGSPLGPGSLQAALQSVGLGNVAVPEPTTFAVIGLCLAGAVTRRRRAPRVSRRAATAASS